MRKNSGFTLVEVMITAAILGGLAVVGMNLTKTMTKSSVKANFDSDVILITNEIVGILSDPTKCFTTLGGKNALSTTAGITAINTTKYYSMAVAAPPRPTNGYGNAGVQIADYSLSATAVDVASNNSYLLIKYQNKNILKGETGATSITKKIKLYVEVDGANNITKCRSLSASSSDIWSRGTGSIIYYNGGNVGIGTSTPSQLLEVNGTIKATDLVVTSDRTAKNEIKKIDASEAFKKISLLRPVSFTWKHNMSKDLGFIAQDLKGVFPELVLDNPDGTLSVRSNSLNAPIVASIQYLRDENEMLKNQIKSLQKENKAIMTELKRIANKLDHKSGQVIRP